MEFTTQNGQVEIKIQASSFKDAANLKKVIMKELPSLFKNIDLSNLSNIDIANVFEKLSLTITNLDSSEDFERAIFECLKYCIYDNGRKNIKITAQLFDDIPELREDYYEIVTKCCEVNLRPFFKSLITEFKTRLSQMKIDIPLSE